MPLVDRDDPGDALRTAIMRQLFSPDYLERLGAMNEQLPRLLRIAAETGRRPSELLSLYHSCLDRDSAGGPYLIYTESKVTGGQERRLPVLDIVVKTMQAEQQRVRQRFPDTSMTELRLFPRPTMNPEAYTRSVPRPSERTSGRGLMNYLDLIRIVLARTAVLFPSTAPM